MSARRTNPDPLLEATIKLFPKLFTPKGKVLLSKDRLGQSRNVANAEMAEFASVESKELPTLAILDESLDQMFLVDVLSIRGFMDEQRIRFLEGLCSYRRNVTVVLAVWNRSDLFEMEEPPWWSPISIATGRGMILEENLCGSAEREAVAGSVV